MIARHHSRARGSVCGSAWQASASGAPAVSVSSISGPDQAGHQQRDAHYGDRAAEQHQEQLRDAGGQEDLVDDQRGQP